MTRLIVYLISTGIGTALMCFALSRWDEFQHSEKPSDFHTEDYLKLLTINAASRGTK